MSWQHTLHHHQPKLLMLFLTTLLSGSFHQGHYLKLDYSKRKHMATYQVALARLFLVFNY
jgi:hypothetical protein